MTIEDRPLFQRMDSPPLRIDPPLEPDEPDEESMTADEATEVAEQEVLRNVSRCVQVLEEECRDRTDEPLHPIDRVWIVDEADHAQCMAILLASGNVNQIVDAAQRLRVLLTTSAEARAYIGCRALELLEAAARAAEQAREPQFDDADAALVYWRIA